MKRAATPLDAERFKELREERDFLLASLQDLEAEKLTGDLSDSQYDRLQEQYTARAATVLRSLASGTEPGPLIAPTSRRRRLTIALGLIALAGVAGLLLASGASLRPPGQTITGNAQSDVDPLVALERAVAQSPEDSQARLRLARYLMGADQPVEAIRQFDETLRLDPDNAEAHAYGGWITFLAGLPDEAMRRLDAAVAADLTYPDAHFFRGMVLLRAMGDEAGAATELRQYLDLVPEGPMRTQVEDVLAGLEGAGSGRLSRPLAEPSGG